MGKVQLNQIIQKVQEKPACSFGKRVAKRGVEAKGDLHRPFVGSEHI